MADGNAAADFIVMLHERDEPGFKERIAAKTGGKRRVFLPTARMVDDFICKLPRGEFSGPQAMKCLFALEAGADLTCPVTTRLHVKTVAEAALSQLAAGSPLSAITPFWRLVGPTDPVGKGLSCGPDFLRERRAEEGSDAQG